MGKDEYSGETKEEFYEGDEIPLTEVKSLEEGLELIRYDGWQDKVWNPLNALVLPGEDNQDIVFVDSKSKQARN